MFGFMGNLVKAAMGNEQSQSVDGNAFGFQVLKNTNADIPIDPWYDFIVDINHRQIDDGDTLLFQQEIRNCAGGAVSLGVWSAKGHQIRDVILQISQDKPTLGLSLQWSPLSVAEDVWHILDVHANSPADTAGLLAGSDYIIGTPSGTVHGDSGLGALVEDHIDRPLQLYVYNHDASVTRTLTITPSRHWGGEGALGCVLGYGALHRLPPPLAEPLSRPGEAMFDSGSGARSSYEDAPQIVNSVPFYDPEFAPQSTVSSPPPPPMLSPNTNVAVGESKVARHRRPQHGGRLKSGGLMDAYMQEGEQKSLAADYTVNEAALGNKAPPPAKLGGPPRSLPGAGLPSLKTTGTPPPPKAADTKHMANYNNDGVD